jgi:glucose/mannose-6-phosphate isomerase
MSIQMTQPMQPRVERLSGIIGTPIFESILWGHEYTLDNLDSTLAEQIKAGHFEKFIFYGMGCSSVVSDIVKGFFITQQVPIDVEVVNDYDTEWFVTDQSLRHDKTLVFIVCYSGWSVEPCLFYERMKRLNGARNLIVLSGGGRIAQMAKEDGNSLIEYKMIHADREYPLYHVQQFFSIFLDLFHKLNIFEVDYEDQLKEVVSYLKKTFDQPMVDKAKKMAQRLQGSRIVLLSTSKWYVQLLKQTTMFFNEIAMVPTHRNLLHEFSHTEVAAYSNPTEKQAIIVLSDDDDDDYTKNKIATLKKLFADKAIPQNKNIEFFDIHLDQKDFFQKFYFAHFLMVYVAMFLGQLSDVEGRNLISIAAKNPWWSQESIDEHPLCVNIPGELSDSIKQRIELV